MKTLGFSQCYNYMQYLIAFFIFLSFSFLKPKTPKDFQWKNRILILNNYQSDSLWFDEGLKAEIQDRKLLIFHFEDGNLENSNFSEEIESSKFLEFLRSNSNSKTAWALIGLDGGVKNSGYEIPLPKDIFKLIDSMPMRQSETKKSNN